MDNLQHLQPLQQLQQQLDDSAAAKARLQGLSEQQARATALRGPGNSVIANGAPATPFGILADMVNHSSGRRQSRELKPQIARARDEVAANASALPLYNAKVKADDVARQAAKAEDDRAAKRKVVELVNVNDPNDIKTVYTENGKYFDQSTGEQVNPSGYKTRSTSIYANGGMRAKIVKGKDEFGLEILTPTGVPPGPDGVVPGSTFIDGTPYDKVTAENRAKTKVGQAGATRRAQETAKEQVKRQTELASKSVANNKSLEAIDQGIKALKAGAVAGPLVDLLPPYRKAAVALQNARDNMGLENIGQYTMGSLSEAEGEWLRAAAMPHLSQEELLPYLIHKKEGLMRIMEANEYEQRKLKAGETPDPRIIQTILYHGGFSLLTEDD